MEKCNVCRNLQPKRFNSILNRGGNIKEIQVLRHTLMASAAAGCEGCLIIHEARKATASALAFHTDYVCVRESIAGAPLLISGMMRGIDRYYKEWGELYTLDEEQSKKLARSWPAIGSDRDVAGSPFSSGTRNLQYEWLQDCILNHPKCQPARDTTLPTRVIYIGTSTTVPRLHTTYGAKGRYATLSHCWGNTSVLTTTLSTLKLRLRAIKMAKMPATFQQAILITRRLGIEYLWMDSLCIIQDSKKDWAKESRQMQNVYTHAIVNISADDASDSTEGLISSRQLSPGVKIRSSKDGGDVYARPLRENMDPSRISHVPRLQTVPHVLDTRAWVVQERILSPRILHFCKHEIAWECDTHRLCECTTRPREPEGREFRKALLNPSLDTHGVAKAWSELVGRYSNTKLTFESDGLIAFAGLASRAAEAWRRTYIAGLWKEDFPHALLWCTWDSASSCRLDESFPSWTWASIRGRILPKSEVVHENKSDFELRLKGIWYGGLEECFDATYGHEINGLMGRVNDIKTKIQKMANPRMKDELRTQFLKLGVVWGWGWLAKMEFYSERSSIWTRFEAEEGARLLPDVSDWSEFATLPGNVLYLLIISIHHCVDHFSSVGRFLDRFYCLVLRQADGFSRFEGHKASFPSFQRIGRYHTTITSNRKDEFLTRFHEQEIYLF